MFSTVGPEMAQKFLNEVRKSICRGKETVYKVKILILSKSSNKTINNSHLPWLKYFPLMTLKSDILSIDSCIYHTNCLSKGPGLKCEIYFYQKQGRKV
jgi:hypothetical protein